MIRSVVTEVGFEPTVLGNDRPSLLLTKHSVLCVGRELNPQLPITEADHNQQGNAFPALSVASVAVRLYLSIPNWTVGYL